MGTEKCFFVTHRNDKELIYVGAHFNRSSRSSVTRLGYFLKFIATNFNSNVAHIFGKLFDHFEKYHF